MFKFYKSDLDGNQSSQIVSGIINNLFNTVNRTSFTTGEQIYKKVWVESDISRLSAILLEGDSIFDYYIVKSTATTIEQVQPSAERYSTKRIDAVIDSSTIQVAKDGLYELWRVGCRVKISTSDSDIFTINSITLIDANTIELNIDNLSSHTVQVGDKISGAYDTHLTSDTPFQFWVEMVIKSGITTTSDFDSVDLVGGA